MNILFISTFDTECGIATYTKDLALGLKKAGHNVFVLAECKELKLGFDESLHTWGDISYQRCWSRAIPLFANIVRTLKAFQRQPDVIHVQHEFGLFPKHDLDKLADELEVLFPKARRVITYHTVLPGMNSYNSWFGIVHTLDGLMQLGEGGIITNAKVIPHGTAVLDWWKQENTKHWLVPGFVAPSKNIGEILKVYSKSYRIFPLKISGLCRDLLYEERLSHLINSVYRIKDYVIWDNRHITDEQMIKDMITAQAVILGRKKKAPYSASGIMHKAFGLGVPVLAKKSNIHNDHGGGAYLWNKETLGDALQMGTGFFKELAFRSRLVGRARSWENVVKKHIEVYR